MCPDAGEADRGPVFTRRGVMVTFCYTEFAPAERSSPAEIAAQVRRVAEFVGQSGILDMVPEALLILNQNRQIVFANNNAIQLLESDEENTIYGLRPGELLDCTHASESTSGCGTTKFCSACGAVKAIQSSLSGAEAIEECRLNQKKSGNALDLRAWAFPLKVAEQLFSLFVITDISDEKRRRILERIFFHDILNTASGIFSFAEILGELDAAEIKEFQGHIYKLSTRLIDEINSQRDLMKAENHELTANYKEVDSLSFITDLTALYSKNDVAKGKNVVMAPDSQLVTFTTDPVLLARVLGNMLKNALESTGPGETVTSSCRKIDNKVQFSVHNPCFISQEIQLQIFLRSFSTKGANRGLGTYSMRLLSERYLQGKVWFTSSKEDGTRFYASYPLSIQ